MNAVTRAFSFFVILSLALLARAEQSETRTGTVRYEPPANEDGIPEFFLLEAHEFPFEQQPLETASRAIEISLVTFPSPVETEHENNNTVHCEYFRPQGEGPFPGVVVLHILGGDFDLSRLFSRTLASGNVAALFLKLPYYGPRSQPGVDAAMISGDPYQTVANMKQAVLDIRRAAAWLAAQDEIDADQLGVTGISLGGITSALAVTAEPRFKKAFLMLAGGDVAQIGWESPEAADLREAWLTGGGTRESLIELLRPVDPCTYGDNVGDRQIIMFNALNDEIVPKACTESLWRAFGEPEITWVEAGHYSAGRYIFHAMAKATRFFQPSASPATAAAD